MFKKGNFGIAMAYLAIICLIVLMYSPVIHFSYVWDDVLDFHDRAWLRSGDEWKHYIFRDFNYWTNYFRPLGIGLFTLQIRLFDDLPGPMHAVSLAMHVVDTLLIGVLSWICLKTSVENQPKRSNIYVAVTMLIYGLHPALIEPVAWIGCQFELLLTMLMLLGLIANLCIQNTLIRAASVAGLFFLAACTKEAALSFPFLLVIFDWLVWRKRAGQNTLSSIIFVVSRNWMTYVATIFSCLAYLAFRFWALGRLIDSTVTDSLTVFAKMQQVCFLYVHYWEMLVWPMVNIGPLHPVDLHQFNGLSLSSTFTDLVAAVIVLIGLRCAFSKRLPVIGCIVLSVTAALLPVLHIVSIDFDSSIYHDRYAMTALTAMCPMLPLLLTDIHESGKGQRLRTLILLVSGVIWLTLAVTKIHATLPMWSTDVNLWSRAVTDNPDDTGAKDSLLAAFIDSGDSINAHKLIDRLMADRVDCDNCMLNAAILAIGEHNVPLAASALQRVRESKQILVDKKMFGAYLLATGEMLVLQGNYAEAEEVLGAAVRMDALNPAPKISLSIALALSGKRDEARRVGDEGIRLLPADQRDAKTKYLEQIIATAASSAPNHRK